MSKRTLPPAWFAVAALCAISLFNPAQAAPDPERQRLVDELRSLSDKSRQQRAADHWLQQALEDLVVRYDWPWRRRILFDDFRDGDYERNPRWEVQRGRFWVDVKRGLRSRPAPQPGEQQPAKEGEEADIGRLILGALLEQALNDGQQSSSPLSSGPSEILHRTAISNAFALETRFSLDKAGGPARFALSLLQAGSGLYGYRLRIQTGPRGFVELERVRGGRSSVVGSAALTRDPGDGKLHELSWRQRPDGQASVVLDGQTLFSLRDKAFRDPYHQLLLTHWAGDLTLRWMRLSGTQ